MKILIAGVLMLVCLSAAQTVVLAQLWNIEGARAYEECHENRRALGHRDAKFLHMMCRRNLPFWRRAAVDQFLKQVP